MDSSASPVPKRAEYRRKSRFGCRNCKLRKLKCDESKPDCSRCRNYGVVCNYNINVPDLQPLSEDPDKRVRTTRCTFQAPQPAISNAIWADDGATYITLDIHDQELFNRFRYETVYSLGGPEMVDIYEKGVLHLLFINPFLMHASLAMAAVHDRYLGNVPACRRPLRESYHRSRSTTLFNKWLRNPIEEGKKDALWAAAGSIGILTFSSLNVNSPEAAWPLGPPDTSDLEWLQIGTAKMALFRLINPLRPQSVFRRMSETFVHIHEALPTTNGTHDISPEIQQLCSIDDSSKPENNPYLLVAHCISQLEKAPNDESLFGKSMITTAQMHGKFEDLLKQKDPISMLLLCLWYVKARKIKWWIDVRARYEVPAICTYLQRYHGDNETIQRLIPWRMQ